MEKRASAGAGTYEARERCCIVHLWHGKLSRFWCSLRPAMGADLTDELVAVITGMFSVLLAVSRNAPSPD